MNGTLYIVATPIGNLNDISQRALETLRAVDTIAAEDTRHSLSLLKHFAINKPLISLHEHNETERIQQLIEQLQSGKSIALISDAGTPLISDPGYHLVQTVQKQNIKIIPIPGACAAITALSAAGLPSDRFLFAGFLPAKSTARRKELEQLITETSTLIFYESPHRILDLLADMQQVFGAERYIALARELTKLYETIRGGSITELLNWLKENPQQQKGEFVVLVHGAEKQKTDNNLTEACRILTILQTELPFSQAVALAAKISGIKKNLLYDIGLKNKN